MTNQREDIALLHEISATLVKARATGRALPGPPAGLPSSLEDAYRIQDQSLDTWNDTVAGWKVGGVPAAYADRYSDKFLAGPIFSRSVFEVEQGGMVEMAIFEGGFAAIEPEFVFCVGEAEGQDRLFIGAEIASSPIPDINAYGPTAVISDFGNNNGLVVGPEIIDWRDRDPTVTVSATIDGVLIAERILDDFRASALEALRFLRNLVIQRGLTLEAGLYVSSGAITGIHEAVAGAHAHLSFGEFGAFEITLANAEKR